MGIGIPRNQREHYEHYFAELEDLKRQTREANEKAALDYANAYASARYKHAAIESTCEEVQERPALEHKP